MIWTRHSMAAIRTLPRAAMQAASRSIVQQRKLWRETTGVAEAKWARLRPPVLSRPPLAKIASVLSPKAAWWWPYRFLDGISDDWFIRTLAHFAGKSGSSRPLESLGGVHLPLHFARG